MRVIGTRSDVAPMLTSSPVTARGGGALPSIGTLSALLFCSSALSASGMLVVQPTFGTYSRALIMPTPRISATSLQPSVSPPRSASRSALTSPIGGDA